MENEKWKKDNQKSGITREKLSVSHIPLSIEKNCSACGAGILRNSSRFCRVCGKNLLENYEPLDSLRASYNLQGKKIQFEAKAAESSKSLFETNKNSASETAWAFAIYSLVPYLGILFCPGAVLMGGVGIFTARRRPYLGGRRISRNSILLGVIVFFIQIFLWYLLYFIPKLKQL